MLVKGLECTSEAILRDVPLQLWNSLTSMTDSRLPVWVLRMFHNKVRYLFVNYLQCYAHYLSLKFLLFELGIFWLIILLAIVVFLFYKFKHYRWLLIGAILLYPVFLIFKIYPR
jgi:hypothetical protein